MWDHTWDHAWSGDSISWGTAPRRIALTTITQHQDTL